ncbi:MAG: ABC transporter ATP-binding protein [Chloroflexi bacterium]|nr:ABC transporter ATP-binding protein [Chloroflexota bacterium]
MVTALLSVEELKTYFFTRRGVAKAVDGVSFALRRGETLGLVGESGCGKSVTCLSILRLVPQPAGRIVGGKILLEGENLLEKSETEMRRIRGGKVAMIPQSPMTALDPVFSIWSQLSETIKRHQKMPGKGVWETAVTSLREVKIPSPEVRLRSYPHQLSGGMRQRVIGAMALACQASLIIADEPTTALDVTIQAQYLSLLRRMRDHLHAGMIFVTHDLGIVKRMCDRVAVMYAGKIVEEAPVKAIFQSPQHPYTMALIKSVPRLDTKVGRLASIEGHPPPLFDLPAGCAFRPRCSEATEACDVIPLRQEIEQGHWVSCHLVRGTGDKRRYANIA